MLVKSINNLINIAKWLALVTMALMMIFITIGVISREFFTPILGDVEIVRLGMVVLIMFGLSYTQNIDGHISIGIIVDKFPKKGQYALDIFSYLLNLFITLIIGIIFIGVGMEHKDSMRLSTDLLNIPYYPLDFIVVIGFFIWTLAALLKLINSIHLFITQPVSREEELNQCQ